VGNQREILREPLHPQPMQIDTDYFPRELTMPGDRQLNR
jgi:hypothetical protein